MQTKGKSPKTKSNRTLVAIRRDVLDRLRDYIERQELPPTMTDVVTLAVERYLDAQEQQS